MAEPTESYPEAATKGGRSVDGGAGEAALREALDEHGEDLAAILDRNEELRDLFETAVVMLASADEDDVEHVTRSVANLVHATDGLATNEAADLAGDVGANARDLAEALELVLELHREGHLEELLAIAETLSALEIDDDAVRGLNTILGAVGEAERESEPTGVLGTLRELRSRDARSGLGYLLALLKAQGRRVRQR